MSFDVQNAASVAGGEVVTPLPLSLEGLKVEPSFLTLSSQATGDDATVLVARHSGGRAYIHGVVKDFAAAEQTLVSTTGEQYAGFTVGQAVWFACVAVQHRSAGDVSVLFVPGAVADVADAVVPTFDEIKAYLDLDDRASFVICGDVRFHRSADTVIDVATSDLRRPAYTDDANKTSAIKDASDPEGSGLAERFWGYLDFPIDLAAAFGLGAGALYVDSFPLPNLQYGGRIGPMEYVGTVAGAGAGADITLKTGIDGTEVTGSDMQLLLATTDIPSTVPTGGTPSAADVFKAGDGLDIEVDAADTAFSSGSGVVKVPIYEFVG